MCGLLLSKHSCSHENRIVYATFPKYVARGRVASMFIIKRSVLYYCPECKKSWIT
jgi:hypothetical protein